VVYFDTELSLTGRAEVSKGSTDGAAAHGDGNVILPVQPFLHHLD
jgi:hypothetical protein